MIDIEIDLTMPDLSAALRGGFPQLAKEVARVTAEAADQWRAYAQGAPLPGGGSVNVRSGGYLNSINARMVSDFHGRVESISPYAKAIEEGTGPRDLKTMLQTSDKTRVSAKGKKYLIIPFRWGTPGAVSFQPVNVMPKPLHALAKRLDPSHVKGMTVRIGGTGKTVPQRLYHWGGRLKISDAQERALLAKGVSATQIKRAQGMVNFRKPGGVGGGAHSSYLTFRVMSEDSPGWMLKARKGLYPAKQTADQYRRIAEQRFSAAAEQDCRAALGR